MKIDRKVCHEVINPCLQRRPQNTYSLTQVYLSIDRRLVKVSYRSRAHLPGPTRNRSKNDQSILVLNQNLIA